MLSTFFNTSNETHVWNTHINCSIIFFNHCSIDNILFNIYISKQIQIKSLILIHKISWNWN